jgi:hypothetical protein
VSLREDVVDAAFDGWARTIHWHLFKLRAGRPSVSNIWRIPSRRGFIEHRAQEAHPPSLIRLEAALPNEYWQADVTHWELRPGRDVEVHRRPPPLDCRGGLGVGSRQGADLVDTFEATSESLGYPTSDAHRQRGYLQRRAEKGSPSWRPSSKSWAPLTKHSRPYQPQTCAKIDRFHKTPTRDFGPAAPGALDPELQRQVGRVRLRFQRGAFALVAGRPSGRRSLGRPGQARARRPGGRNNTSEAASTSWTATARSPCATTRISSTSQSAVAGKGRRSAAMLQTSKSAGSPSTASCYASSVGHGAGIPAERAALFWLRQGSDVPRRFATSHRTFHVKQTLKP